jgi:hypothetical protein
MLDIGIFSLVYLLMECSCIAPLTPTVMAMMGVRIPSTIFYGVD